MQISAPTTSPAPAAIPAGTVLGRGTVMVHTSSDVQHQFPVQASITSGAVLATGIRDIRDGAMQLVRRHWEHPTGDLAAGLVAFVRNGDTWDAVAMLAPTRAHDTNRHQLWSPGDLTGFTPSTDVKIDAIWQISAYGSPVHDYDLG